MRIIKFKVTKSFAERHEGVSEGDILDGVDYGESMEVVAPSVNDGFGFKTPRSVPVVAGEDGEVVT